MNKKWTLILLCACALALMTGCATNADVLPSPSPSLMPSPSAVITMPIATALPQNTTSPMATDNGVMTLEEAVTVSDNVETEVGKLSEIDTATAVVIGNMAVVGVTFDSQYKGGMTTRLTDMVKDRVGTVKNGITTIGVTSDPTMIKTIRDLKTSLDQPGTSLESVRNKVSDLVGQLNATPNATSTVNPSAT